MGISNQFGVSRASSPGSVSDPRMGTISSGGPTFLAKLISDISVNAGKGPITVPTIGDFNGDRWGFNGSVWTETDAEQPRFYNGALYMEGSHTELSGYSGDIGNWSTNTTASVAQNAVGLRGNSNEAFTLTDNSAAANQERRNNTSISSGSDTYYLVTRVKYNASPAVYPLILFSITGGTALNQGIVLDLSDGTYSEAFGDGEVVSVVRDGDYWNVTQSITDNSTGNTTAAQRLLPAWNTDGTATGAVATQGSTVFASCELYKDSPSYAPILTTGGSTKTVNADTEYTIPIGNWPDGDVSVEMEVTPFWGSVAASYGILTPLSSTYLRGVYWGANQSVTINDGPNSTNKTSAWSAAGETIKVKAIASVASGKMNISVDGATATESDYDNSFNPSGSIVLGKSLTRAMAIKNIKIYPVSLGDGWLGS